MLPFARERIVPLVDADHALSGVLSKERPASPQRAHGNDAKRPHWLGLLIGSGRLAEGYAHEHAAKAGEAMTRNVETIGEDTELSEAVDRMIQPPASGACRCCGATPWSAWSHTHDLLKGLPACRPRPTAPRSDAEIKAAILAEFDKLEWAPRGVRVEVPGKAVTFKQRSIIDQRLREGAQGHRPQPPAGLRRRPRPLGVDRAQFRRRHSVGRRRPEGVKVRS